MSFKKFLERTGAVTLLNVLMQLRGLLYLPVLSKIWGTFYYGVWSQVTVTLGVFLPFVALGIPTAMNRFLPIKKGRELSKGFYSAFLVMFLSSIFVGALILIFSSSLAAYFFGGAAQAVVVKIITLLLASLVLNHSIAALLQAKRRIKLYTSISTVQLIIETVGVIAMVLFNFAIVPVLLFLVATKIVIFAAVWLFWVLPEIGISYPQFSIMKKYLKFGVPTIFAGFGYWLLNVGDRYVIAFFKGASDVGIYSVAYKTGAILLLVIYAIYFVLFPTLSKLRDEKQFNEIKKYVARIFKLFIIFSLPAFFGLLALSHPIIRSISTIEFASKSGLVAPIVSLGILFYGIFLLYALVILAENKTKLYAKILLLGAAINLILNLWLVPIYGIEAAAWTTLFSFLLIAILAYYFAPNYCKTKMKFVYMLKSFIASLLMYFAISLFNLQYVRWYGVLAVVALGALVYLFFVWLLRVFDKKEQQFIFSLLAAITSKFSR